MPFFRQYILMKRNILIILLALFASVNLLAQSNNITWRSSAKMLNTKEGEVTLKATLSPGWHLYGTNIPKGGPQSTTFNFDNSKGILFTDEFTPSSAPTDVFDPIMNITLNWWENTVTFKRKFVLTGDAEPRIEGTILYMICNNETCVPPQRKKISIAVPKF